MDALYTVKTKYTYKEYRKFSYYCMWHSSRVILAICYIVMAALLIRGIINGNIISSCMAVAFFVVMPIFVEYTFKKAYTSKKSNSGEIVMRFYEAHIESEGAKSSTKVLYKNLYKIVETKTSFYVMMGNNMGFIVMKDDCPEGLIEFIRSIKKD